MCRRFAEQNGLPWAGSLAFGMGGSLARRGSSGRRSRGSRLSWTRPAGPRPRGDPIPADGERAFAGGAMPKVFYLTVAQTAWRWQAYRNKADAPIRHRRYAQ